MKMYYYYSHKMGGIKFREPWCGLHIYKQIFQKALNFEKFTKTYESYMNNTFRKSGEWLKRLNKFIARTPFPLEEKKLTAIF